MRLIAKRLLLVSAFGLMTFACGEESSSGPSDDALVSSTTTAAEAAVVSSTTTSEATPASSTTEAAAPIDEAPVDPRVEDALETARTFMQGFADRDLETVTSHAVEGHVFGLIRDSFDQFPEEFAWLDAIGWTITVDGCEITNPEPANTKITCDVSHENAWSRALDVGPYRGEFPMRVMHEGDDYLGTEIQRSTVTTRTYAQFQLSSFLRETWDPFVAWVDDNHPEDLAVMFTPQTFPEIAILAGQPTPSLTAESIALWRDHTQTFVAELGAG